MANLEVRNRSSAIQLAIILTLIGLGSQVITAPDTLMDAEQHAWISLILAAGIFLLAAWAIYRLTEYYAELPPEQLFTLLWGRKLNYVAQWLIVLMLIEIFSIRIQGYARQIAFYLFDRTPLEIVIIALIAASFYGAMQNWGTIVRFSQVVFFLGTPLVVLLIGLTYVNFSMTNLMPFWPVNLKGVLLATVKGWILFAGYETVYFLQSYTNSGEVKPRTGIGLAFVMKAGLIITNVIGVYGALGVPTVKVEFYPTLAASRLIELPGTFVERLDNYLLLSWVPVGVVSISVVMFVASSIIGRLHGLADHRPLVAVVSVVMFFSSIAMHDLVIYQYVVKFVTIFGLFFSLVFIPVSLLRAWWIKK